ncbi:MAG: TonB-dependent receptor plug domain-containing protein [Lewinellaceae bacterium]|nr:TonB-dependent receptor plug domain-containing protein [Saprospiraceae bacterium]MCB9342306.1 TonB-dependent receptor plug domain-containing protein [Lewinellaceae bacterium]
MTCVVKCWHFAFLFFTPILVFSQQTDTLKSDRLKEVVIQTTRTGSNSPIPHTNFKAEQIEQNLQAQDIPMLLSSVPSLVESSDAGSGIGYTGLRIRGSDPTRVNVTINGVPLNDSESQGMYWVDLPDLAASASEIQVQRGVGNSTHGAGAFGATVNIDLSNIDADPEAVVSSTIGSFGTRKLSAKTGTGLMNGRWHFSGRASLIHSDGYIDRASADLQSLHLSAAMLRDRQSLQVHLLSGKEITYQAWNGVPSQYVNDEVLRTFNTAGIEQPGGPYKDEVDNYSQQHLLGHYKLLLNSGLSLQVNGHYTKGAGYYEQYKAAQFYGDYGFTPWRIADTSISNTDLVRRLWLDNDFYGGTFALRWQAVKGTDLMLGGGLNRYDGNHFGEVIWTENPVGVPKDFEYYRNTAEKLDGNVFVKLEQKVSEKFRGFVDLQARIVEYTFQGFDLALNPTDQSVRHLFFNPKLGATYSISDKWTGYGYFGIAHREPNRDDYTQSSPDSRPKSEQLADTELGIRLVKEDYQFSANLFWMQYWNQLALDGQINKVGAYIRTNIPDSYRAGVELEGSTSLNQRLSLHGNLALSQNKVKSFTEFIDNWDTWEQETVVHTNTDLAFSPGVIANAGIMATIWGKQLQSSEFAQQITVSLSGKYVGKQYLDNTSNDLTSLPAYFTSDLRLNMDFTGIIGKKISLILALNNWLDAKYSANGWTYRYISGLYDARADDPYAAVESGDVYHLAGYFPQAGRNWMATVKITF